MQTVENPSEQPEREYPETMPVMDEHAIFGSGFHIMRRMYLEPLKPFIFFSDWLSYEQWTHKIADLIVIGYVAVTDGGFQLTALGRLVFHAYYEEYKQDAQERAQNSPFWSNYTPSELAMLEVAYGNEVQPFDLGDF